MEITYREISDMRNWYNWKIEQHRLMESSSKLCEQLDTALFHSIRQMNYETKLDYCDALERFSESYYKIGAKRKHERLAN